VIITFHVLAVVVLGIANVHVSWVAAFQTTDVASMFDEPERVSLTVGVATKFAPVIVAVKVSPAKALSGSIFLNDGGFATVAVAVVSAVVALVVTTVVGTVVGADVGIDETVTWVIFTLYTFSIVERGYVSVFEFIRYPHVPSDFL